MSNDKKTMEDVRNLIVCDTQFGWTGSTTLRLQQMLALQERGWLAEGAENNEFDLTDAGRDVVARALQSAVQPTLADVQPGGRVRLGDEAERARFEAWGRVEGLPLARAKLGGYAFEVTAKAWLAWQYLSAQPSPGGQDARAQFEEYRGGDCERDAQGYYVHGRTAQDWALWQAALAARQPVGEPVGVATVVHSKHFDKTQCTFMRSDVQSA